jgi:hypothetical protein
MNEQSEHVGGQDRLSGRDLAEMSTPEIIEHITRELRELAGKQVALARAELRSDARTEIATAGGLAGAAAGALVAVTLLLVAGVLALARVIPGWAAALIAAGFVAALSAVAALVSWRNRVRNPLGRSREVISAEAHWRRDGSAHDEQP